MDCRCSDMEVWRYGALETCCRCSDMEDGGLEARRMCSYVEARRFVAVL